MTLGALMSRDNSGGKYEGIGIHCVPHSIIYTLLQGTVRFGTGRYRCRKKNHHLDGDSTFIAITAALNYSTLVGWLG